MCMLSRFRLTLNISGHFPWLVSTEYDTLQPQIFYLRFMILQTYVHSLRA